MSNVVAKGFQSGLAGTESRATHHIQRVDAGGDALIGEAPPRDARPGNAGSGKRVYWGRRLWQSLTIIKAIVLSPITLLLAVRRSMTGASATLLIVSIMSLNIIWGYPWTGMFAACVSLMVVGWVVNQLMRPRLKVDFSLPRLCPAGQPFSIVTHLTNRRQLPAMDLHVGFHRAASSRGEANPILTADSGRPTESRGFSQAKCRVVSADQGIEQIPPRGRVDLSAKLAFDHRGIQTVPDVVITSLFPFHLFRSTTRLSSETSIAITPRPLSGAEDSVSHELLQALGGWSHQLLSGDALDYTGSREYQHGMAVRRWDFASWARLGRPIVREFQSPSVQMVSLLVDTSIDEAAGRDRKKTHELLERVLSLAATAVIDLTSKAVRIRLYITHEELDASPQGELSLVGDADALLIRLAGAARVSTSVAEAHARGVLGRLGRDPMLVLTSRSDFGAMQHSGNNVTLLRVDTSASDVPGKPDSITPAGEAIARKGITNGRSA